MIEEVKQWEIKKGRRKRVRRGSFEYQSQVI
jgi:hypothetical protein